MQTLDTDLQYLITGCINSLNKKMKNVSFLLKEMFIKKVTLSHFHNIYGHDKYDTYGIKTNIFIVSKAVINSCDKGR